MTLIVETNTNADARMLAAMLKRLDFVKTVSISKTAKSNKPNTSLAKQKKLTDKDWILPGRPATDEETEQMLNECEASPELTAKEAKALTMKKLDLWIQGK